MYYQKISLVIIFLSFVFIGHSSSIQNGSDLQQLSNNVLLSRAEKIYTLAVGNFREELRRLNNHELQSNKMQNELNAFPEIDSELVADSDEFDAIQLSSMRVQHRNDLLESQKQKLILLEAARGSLDELIFQLDITQSTGVQFSERLDSLDIYLIEINLRLTDGSLLASEVPDSISYRTINAERNKLSEILENLKNEEEIRENEFIKIARSINETKFAISESEISLFSAKNKYLQEQKNLELENRYKSMQPQKLVTLFAGLWEEKKWLMDTYNNSVDRYVERQTYADAALHELERLPPIETQDIQASLSGNPNQAIKEMDSLLFYNASRISKLVKWQGKLKELKQEGEVFEVEALVSGEHISRMMFIAEILKLHEDEGRIGLSSLLPDDWYNIITEENQSLNQRTSELTSLNNLAQSQFTQNPKELKKLISTQKEIDIRKLNLKRGFESKDNMDLWKAGLDTISEDELLERFKSFTNILDEKQKELQEITNTYTASDEKVKNIKRDVDALKNPFYMVVQDESSEEKDKIISALYEFAELKPLKRVTQHALNSRSPLSGISFLNTRNTTDSENIYNSKGSEEYQNLLSKKVGIIEKRNQYHKDFKNAIDTLLINVESLIKARDEIKYVLQKRYHCSTRIIRLFGKGTISNEQVPKEIITALKDEEIERFESLTEEIINVKLYVLQQLEDLNQTKNDKEQYDILLGIKNNLSSRVEIHQQLQALEKEFVNKEPLTGIALKIAEQLAESRHNSGNTIKDLFFDFARTAETDNYSEILRSSYIELIEIEKKQQLLSTQSQKLDRLIKLENFESSFIPEMLTLLNTNLQQLQDASEEEKAKVEASLKPQNAIEILNTYELKTGKRIFAPPPVPENSRHEFINSSADLLYDYFLQIATIKRWLNLFRYRMTPSGIESEIDLYNMQIGEIDAKKAILDAKEREFIGHPKEILEKLDPEERPVTEYDELRFLKGKIGALRKTRNQWRLKSAKKILLKIILIVFCAFLLILGINSISKQVIEQIKKPDGEGIKKPKSWAMIVISKISRFFRKRKEGEVEVVDDLSHFKNPEFLPMFLFVKHILVILIWIITISLLLESLGFEVGAILAGLGIGGFAIAFALKDILADFFGGMTIMATKPFKVGDLIMFNNETTKVEEIGIRYSKLSTSAFNNLVTVPNSMLTAKELVNLSHYPGQLVTSDIKLSPKNNHKKVKLANTIIDKIFAELAEDVSLKWVRHDSFVDNSFVIKYKYEILDDSKGNQLRNYINNETIRLFQKNNIQFSQPILN